MVGLGLSIKLKIKAATGLPLSLTRLLDSVVLSVLSSQTTILIKPTTNQISVLFVE